jgi:hypothetical protein
MHRTGPQSGSESLDGSSKVCLKIGKKILKKKRKGRDASGERHYFCGCQCSYLTYSSLYTHVKSKHNGIFPSGSLARIKMRVIPAESAVPDSLSSIQNFYESFSDGLCAFKDAYACQDGATISMAATVFSLPSVDAFPEYLQLKSEYEYFCDIQNRPLADFIDSLSVYRIVTFYLCSIESVCSLQFLREYAVLGGMVCKALNESSPGTLGLAQANGKEGKRLANDRTSPDRKPGDQTTFCHSLGADQISENMNHFVTNRFPRYFNAFQSKSFFHFLGREASQVPHLVFMARMIANWLFHTGVTDYRLEINNEL